ncbi:RimJ/RimL family protein N-acetyltransferase [Kitasatospora sp. GP30]|uniref:GNAT family N-acetyltransferase n=1 Tax=Kitasatospora sp. GP30 TaxID=3035084 RepID=UPI000C7152D3|nr:GNAT family N-acetyltransferase [Kitasatospora sp. GP30]MDH6143722.1 RimJ/RimL family protein N-acetyltransferase [Kitasatospora sp. GP30]
MAGQVELQAMDEQVLAGLLAVAVADAAPEEVMPPVAGPPGWTQTRQEAFRAWHRAHRPGLAGPLGEVTFAVVDDGSIVGSARLARRDPSTPGVLETGLWLARSRRGRGTGTAALRLIRAEAARLGADHVVADTRSHNAAALGALRRNGAALSPAPDGDQVEARLPVT